MAEKTEKKAPELRNHAGQLVTVEGDRFHCDGCGGGYSSPDPQTAAEDHARFCAIAPLPR
jgi:hypothetical protein